MNKPLLMVKNTLFFWLVVILISSCHTQAQKTTTVKATETVGFRKPDIKVGAAQLNDYKGLLKEKRIGLIANQGSIIPSRNGDSMIHLVDTLLSLDIDVIKVFSPEHGFRGTADAGAYVNDGIDAKTGLPLVSLYGVNKKPSEKQLSDLDILVFDIQDVGVRFYTYISTLHYVMEAAAENDIPVIVLDRANPNIHYVDGPVLQPQFESFVGLHPVPVVYGMSIGEYAQMINGENWLNGGILCDLTVIKVQNYTRSTTYDLPTKPSPNLPNAQSINLYPSLCFFEGTDVSCGRGTDFPFQIFGNPNLPETTYFYSFIPKPNAGASNPKHQGKICQGLDLRKEAKLNEIQLQWLIDSYDKFPNKETFFNHYFNTLAGNAELQEQIKLGYSQEDIKKSWQPDLEKFKKVREKYLLYP